MSATAAFTARATAKAFFTDLGTRLRTTVLAKRPERLLVLKETLSLGEKRFVAVVECDGKRILIGGGAQSVALLAQLDQEDNNRAK